MKKPVKIIVPVLLALLIIFSLVWYGFIYDRDFTRDMLLKQARFFSTNGNQSVASWFYDMAYEFSAQDEDVAIELANQFKSEGNYTKAEYTLSNAIADGGTVDLYIALCKTYVEQDKLLDAVAMLDNVSDPAIKAQLDAMRPAAPSSDPVPGFYSQYIPVTLNGSDGTLYYTLDGEYPSIDDVPYSEPFTLPGGETTVYAVNVADNGLVSPLSVLGFTVGGVIEEVTFEDSAIEQAIRTALNVSESETLYSNQLWTITSFTVPAEAQVLSDLTKLPYLETLVIQDHSIDSLQFLSALTFLSELDLTGSRFSSDNLSIIASVPLLQKLTLADCGLSTIAGLENAANLAYLDLGNNTVRNLEPLTPLVNLKQIDLQHNAVTNLSALSALSNLEKLDVSYNSLTGIAPIASCAKLTWLNVGNNKLTSLSGVESLSALTYLYASSNQLTDANPAAKCLELQELYVASNKVTNVSGLSALIMLETLDISHNQVTELPTWPNAAALRTIDGSYNSITSLSPLKNLQNLSHIYMDYNQITSVAELESCYNLVMVSVYGNAVTGVEKLTAHDIIVNYDPTATSNEES